METQLLSENFVFFYYICLIYEGVENLLRMYVTTGGVRPCLERVMSTSAALFLHITLCGGHQEVIAVNSRVKSSFLANSSADIL